MIGQIKRINNPADKEFHNSIVRITSAIVGGLSYQYYCEVIYPFKEVDIPVSEEELVDANILNRKH